MKDNLKGHLICNLIMQFLHHQKRTVTLHFGRTFDALSTDDYLVPT